MKKNNLLGTIGYIAGVVGLFLVLMSPSYGSIIGTPFTPEEDTRFDNLEGSSAFNAKTGKHPMQVITANYDFTVNGGASAVSAYKLGVTVPANALITRTYIWVEKPFAQTTDSGNNVGNIAFDCKATGYALNLVAAAHLNQHTPTSNYAVDGVATGTSTVFQNNPTACVVQATITTGDVTAGKATLIIHYVLHP